ncbi:MAG: hypothetical protein ACQER2_06640 [Bacillota bacterium]
MNEKIVLSTVALIGLGAFTLSVSAEETSTVISPDSPLYETTREIEAAEEQLAQNGNG